MYSLQEISLTDEEYKILEEVYQEETKHEIRQRAHAILMRSKGFTRQDISIALNLKKWYVFFLIKAWFYFGIDGLLTDNVDLLWEEVKILETPLLKEEEENQFWEKFKNIILSPFKLIYFVVLRTIHLVIKIVSKFFIFFGKIDWKKYYTSSKYNAKNVLTIGRDSSNNIVFQINNFFTTNEGKKKVSVEEIKASSLEETKEKFRDLLTRKGQNLISNSDVLSLIFALNDKIQKLENEERRKRLFQFLITAAAFYIYFHTTVKSGVVLFTLLGSTIMIFNIRSCVSEKNIVENEPPIIASIDSSFNKNTDSLSTIMASIDSNKIKKEPDTILLPNYIPKEDCSDLTEIATQQRSYIDQDTTPYSKKDFYIKEPDERIYLHVAAYQDIKTAGFQREYLLEQGYANCKIIEIPRKDDLTLYAVTIGDFVPNQVLDLCELKEQWDELCYSKNGKAKLKFNK